MNDRDILGMDGLDTHDGDGFGRNFRTRNRQRDWAPFENFAVHWREVFWVTIVLVAFAAAVVWVNPAYGAVTLPGPIPAEVVRVVDGDTLRVRGDIWPGHTVEVLVRLDGIDAPELRGRCQAEREAVIEAKRILAALLPDKVVSLTSVCGGKFAGPVVARVRTSALR